MWTPLEDMPMDRVRDGTGSDSPITPGHTAAVSSNPTSDTICDGLAVEVLFALIRTELLFLMLVFSEYDDLLQLAYNTERSTK